MSDSKNPPPYATPLSVPQKPAFVPEELWGTMPDDRKAHTASLVDKAASNMAILDGIPAERGTVDTIQLTVTSATSEFDDLSSIGGEFGSLGNGLPVPDIAGPANAGLDRKREDAKAVLAATMAELDKAMWQAVFEHGQRQREIDRREAAELRERDRQEARAAAKLEAVRLESQRKDDAASADKLRKEDKAASSRGFRFAMVVAIGSAALSAYATLKAPALAPPTPAPIIQVIVPSALPLVAPSAPPITLPAQSPTTSPAPSR